MDYRQLRVKKARMLRGQYVWAIAITVVGVVCPLAAAFGNRDFAGCLYCAIPILLLMWVVTFRDIYRINRAETTHDLEKLKAEWAAGDGDAGI
jgi:hypothetical protein